MAEPTLAFSYATLQSEVGLFLGWGRGSDFGDTAWDSQTEAIIVTLVKSGYHQFLNTPAVPNVGSQPAVAAGYRWSFLTPTASLALAEDAQTIPLPDDFGGFEGQITVLTSDSTSQPWTIQWANEGVLRNRYAVMPDTTGPPMMVAQRPVKGTTPTAGQRFELFVFPIADQDYTLQGTYYVNPDALSDTFPFPYGGAQHAETLKASCIAAAELYLDDMRGPRWQYFLERLQASIAVDRRSKSPRVGYNRDRSDSAEANRLNPHYWAPAATYNSASFD